jgi:hypothetical protein
MCGLPFIPTLTSRRAADAHDDGPRSCRRAERQQGFSTSRLAQPPARHRLQSKPTRPAVLTIAAAQPPPTCGCGWSCAATGCIWRCVTPAPGCCGWLPPTLTPRGAAGCGWSSSSPPPGDQPSPRRRQGRLVHPQALTTLASSTHVLSSARHAPGGVGPSLDGLTAGLPVPSPMRWAYLQAVALGRARHGGDKVC